MKLNTNKKLDPLAPPEGMKETFFDFDKFSTISLAASNFLSSKNATPYFSIASLKSFADSDSASA